MCVCLSLFVCVLSEINKFKRRRRINKKKKDEKKMRRDNCRYDDDDCLSVATCVCLPLCGSEDWKGANNKTYVVWER